MIMLILFSLICPLISAGILFKYFHKEVTWFEPAIYSVIPPLFSMVLYLAYSCGITSDTERWGNYLVQAEYYEAWDEWVTKTCSREVPCGRNKDGSTRYRTEYYDCSYRDYHPPYWCVIDNSGKSHAIDQSG